MTATREDLVRIARDVVTGTNRPTYCECPATFDPHEWVLEAMQRAYAAGRASMQPVEPRCARCGRTECLRRALPCIDYDAENARVEAASGWSEP